MTSRHALVLSLLLAGCGGSVDHKSLAHIDTLPNGAERVVSPVAQWKAGEGWRVAQDFAFPNPSEGPGAITSVRSYAVDAHGCLFMLDPQGSVIQQYAADGSFVRTIGRKGGGPGEMQDPIGLGIHGDRVYLIDQGNIRITIFDTSGALIGTHPRSFENMGTWKWEGGIDTAGVMYDMKGTMGAELAQRWQLARLNPDSFTVVDTFPYPAYQSGATLVKKSAGGTSRTTMFIPYSPDLITRYDPRGYFWVAMSDKYEIAQRRLKGDTARLIVRPWKADTLTASARARLDTMRTNLTRDGFTLPEFPTSVPAFGAFVTDRQGNLWVGPYSSRDTIWQVFDTAGVWLGPVVFPAPILDLSFAGDHYYGITLDSMDVPQVVRGAVLGKK